VIFDEATTALDVVTQGQVLREIRRLQEELHVTSILITHDVSVVSETCRKAAVMYAGHIMEAGPVDRVLVTPRHPYTQGLLACYPSLIGDRRRLRGIPGTLPDLKADQAGCAFAPRCARATDVCSQEAAPVVETAPGHLVRCHMEVGGERT
jgi:peptide/nickel transport system ATP-binding protein